MSPASLAGSDGLLSTCPMAEAACGPGAGASCAVEAMVESSSADWGSYRRAKRVLDVVFSLVVLAGLSGGLLLIALAIKWENAKAPVIFKQTRIGKNGRPFTLYKFRTMCVDAEEQLFALRDMNKRAAPLFKMSNDPRVTPVGRFLRKMALDELPQFVNVIKGDISVVGPRPMLPAEIDACAPCQRKRLLIDQGITCYWQTRKNRDHISFDEHIGLDLLYVKKCSVWTDAKLVIQTVGTVLMGQGD